jgi:arsenical pump membrane protein
LPVAQLAIFPILLLTCGLAVAQPRIGPLRVRLTSAALLGAGLTILSGAVSPAAALDALEFMLLPVVTIASLMTITLAAEQIGLFRAMALHAAQAAGGDGGRLFGYIFLAGTITGTLFTNDAAILIFTPLVWRLLEDVQEDHWTLANKLPFYFAVLYVANLAGPLLISNPINIVVCNMFDIGFVKYARWMMLPALMSAAVTYLGLRLVFRKHIPKTYRVDRLQQGIQPEKMVLIGAAVILLITLAGFFSSHWTGLPTWMVALVGSGAMLWVAFSGKRLRTRELAGGMGWDVLVFAVCIFIVVLGVRNTGITAQLGGLLQTLGGDNLWQLNTATALVAGVTSSLINNHPTANLMALTITDMEVAGTRMLVFSALIGGDLGPRMLPIGSLAALLWFRMLRERGIEISRSLYVKIGVPLTLATILLSVLVLNLEMWLLRGR